MNRMNKDEFKEAMRQAKIDEEVNELMNETEGIEDPEEIKPKRRAGRRRTTTRKTTKAEPVAAGQKKPRKKPGPKPKNKAVKIENKDEEITIKTLNEVMDKAARQKEALQVAISIMAEKTDRIIIEAGKMVNLAELYNGYMETLEEMTE